MKIISRFFWGNQLPYILTVPDLLINILSNYFPVNNVERLCSIKSHCIDLYVNIPLTHAIPNCLLKNQ